jgi:hypothetical protein
MLQLSVPLGSSLLFVDVALGIVGVVLLWHLLMKGGRASEPPYPPGPRGLPLIGNILDMPAQKEWITFSKWGRDYGLSFRS